MPRLSNTCMLRCLLVSFSGVSLGGDDPALRVATFDVDATPPLGSPVAYARVQSVVDPLHAKGIVLLPSGQPPIVICVLDWIGIANGGHDWWRQTSCGGGQHDARARGGAHGAPARRTAMGL